MEIVSVSVGLPRDIESHGKRICTSIFKSPPKGRLRVNGLNIAGDEQSDLRVHGGSDKAVYAYPSEHYRYWRDQLPDADLAWGSFGENLTTRGLLEVDVAIGDVLRAGSVEFMVTQPRIPRSKLAVRFGLADMVKRFAASCRSGFYLAVLAEGEIVAGDGMEVFDHATERMSIREINDLYYSCAPDLLSLRRALCLPGRAEAWRREISEIIEKLEQGQGERPLQWLHGRASQRAWPSGRVGNVLRRERCDSEAAPLAFGGDAASACDSFDRLPARAAGSGRG